MAPRLTAAQKRMMQRMQATNATLLAALGKTPINADTHDSQKALPGNLTPQEQAEIAFQEMLAYQERVRLEAESVLFYVETRGAGFKDKECKECGEIFTHRYGAVAYCSDDCRSSSLASLGVYWNPQGKTDLERWDGRIPKVLSPVATLVAKAAVEALTEKDEEA